MSRSRPSLQQSLVRSMAAVAGAAVVLSAVLVLWAIHRQGHLQTDAMLVQMARTEADGVLSEVAEHGIHVHDTRVMLPTVGGAAVEKYSLAFDAGCGVRAATGNIAVDRVPAEWCRRDLELGDVRVFNTSELADIPLRAASFVARQPDGAPIVFLAAVPHGLVDTAVWRSVWVVVLAAGIMLVAVLGVSAWLGRRLTGEIRSLSGACGEVAEELGELDDRDVKQTFAVSQRAPAELKTLADTLTDLLRRLRRMTRIQNRFIAEAAHDLRTPLTALRGEVELTLRREREAEEYRETLVRVGEDVGRLTALTENLLEVARADSEAAAGGKMSLRDAVEAAVERQRGRLEKAGVDAQVEWTGPTFVRADQMAVSRVLDNLLGNVAEHSGASTVRIWTETREEAMELHVADDGDGLDGEDPEALFAPFHRRPQTTGGHGLGLFIARKLMRSSQGELEIRPSGAGVHFVARFRPV